MIPGAGMAASGGGLPPSTAVARSWPRFVDGRYVAFTFGYLSLNPSRTALKDSPSAPVQSARIVTLPETFWPPPSDVVAVVSLDSSSSSPPQLTAPSERTSANSRATSAQRLRLMNRLLSRPGRRWQAPFQ